MKKTIWFMAAAFWVNAVWAGVGVASTLDVVKKRGFVYCGVSTGVAGFSTMDDKGRWSGLDVDMCRAVAAAVLGDADKVEYKSLTGEARFTPLLTGDIDLLCRNTTWTLTRDSKMGLNFTGVSYYDGQGFMVLEKNGVTSARQLSKSSVCITRGTTTELNLRDYFKENNMEYTPEPFDNEDTMVQAFENGRCKAMTADLSRLYALRLKLSDPGSAVVLPEVISKEPLGPVVRQGDDIWFDIVKWSLFVMINAEEMGVTSANADSMKKSSRASVVRLLGAKGKGQDLGLKDDWSYQIIKQVGNYGEVFERNLGRKSSLKIERGLNGLWRKGGILYAPPIR